MPKKKASFMNRASTALTAMESDMFHTGFHEENRWVDTGNLALNRMMSGKYDGGFLFGKNYVLYGESGSGKSLKAAYLCAHAQRDHNAFIFWFDVEKASEEEFFLRAGVDTGEEGFQISKVAELEDVYKGIQKITKMYRQAVKDGEDLPPMVIIVDSWSMVLTKSQTQQIDEGKLTGDQGQKAKQTGDVITRLNHMVTGLPVLTVGIAHVYDSQEQYGRRHKTTGGHKLQFAATGCLMLTKSELKDEDVEDPVAQEIIAQKREGYTADLKKRKHIEGFICTAENLKSRVSKPFQKVVIQVPYHSGMDKWSGLFTIMMEEGTIWFSGGAWYAYKDEKGEEKKFMKKDFRDLAPKLVELAVSDISDASLDVEEPADGGEEVSE